jgi:hypothetical protein
MFLRTELFGVKHWTKLVEAEQERVAKLVRASPRRAADAAVAAED